MKIYKPSDINEIKGLPDWFDYNKYVELSKETDLSVWAIEFIKRQPQMNHEKLIESTGGITYKKDISDAKTEWRNGIYVNWLPKTYLECIHKNYLDEAQAEFIPNEDLHEHPAYGYLEKTHKNYLDEAQAEFIPDENLDKHPNLKIKDYISTTEPNPIKEFYEKYTGKKGRTYFPDKDLYDKYKSNIKYFNKRTDTILINIEMPINKILREVENRIKVLREHRRIQEIELQKYNKFDTWAMGLACFDLKAEGLKNVEIKKKYLSYCYTGSQIDNDHTLTNDDHNRWKDTYNPTLKMINGYWKILVGNPT